MREALISHNSGRIGACSLNERRAGTLMSTRSELPAAGAPSGETEGGRTLRKKLVFVGESNVGKTSLMTRLCDDRFIRNQPVTLGAAGFKVLVVRPEGFSTSVRFDIWDTAGQEQYHSLAPLYYRGAHAVIIVYDVTLPESRNRALVWLHEIKSREIPNLVIALAGNKVDLPAKKVDFDCVSSLARTYKYVAQETSAKHGTGIKEIVMEIARRLVDKEDSGEDTRTASVQLDVENYSPPSQSVSCCST